MTEAQEEFVQHLTASREEIVDASSELDAMEAIDRGANDLSAIDAAIQIEKEFTHRPK